MSLKLYRRSISVFKIIRVITFEEVKESRLKWLQTRNVTSKMILSSASVEIQKANYRGRN